jgi:segregation and condensation protein B
MMNHPVSELSLEALIENLLFVAAEPLSLARLVEICGDFPGGDLNQIESCMETLMQKYQNQSIELKLLAGGYVMQTRIEYAHWIQKIWAEKPRKYSQAFLEVLAIIAYEQPVTRAEIEHKRGVSVAPNMIKSLIEREWIKIVGYKDAPGKPALYATTLNFLDYFNLSSLDELPKIQPE